MKLRKLIGKILWDWFIEPYVDEQLDWQIKSFEDAMKGKKHVK